MDLLSRLIRKPSYCSNYSLRLAPSAVGVAVTSQILCISITLNKRKANIYFYLRTITLFLCSVKYSDYTKYPISLFFLFIARISGLPGLQINFDKSDPMPYHTSISAPGQKITQKVGRKKPEHSKIRSQTGRYPLWDGLKISAKRSATLKKI